MARMELSIIIPVYKTPIDLFRRCMASVLSWPGDGIEIIVVIDSPGDPIEDEVRVIASQDRRILVLRNEKNMGPSCSRNRGIDAAIGDYVMMVDADDEIVPQVCVRALYACRKNGYAFCGVSRVFPWQRDGIDITETHKLYCGSIMECCNNSIEYIINRLDMSSSGVIFDKKFLNSNKLRYPEDLRQNEDFVFVTSIISKCPVVGLNDEYGYKINWHAASLSCNSDLMCYENQLIACGKVLNLIKDLPMSNAILRFYANHGYNQLFSGWHKFRIRRHEDENLCGRIQATAFQYIARYDVILSMLAKVIICMAARTPWLLFRPMQLWNIVFRIVRKFNLYYR